MGESSINWQLSIAIGPSYIKVSGGISLSHFCWPYDQPQFREQKPIKAATIEHIIRPQLPLHKK